MKSTFWEKGSCPPPPRYIYSKGFTLSELLIALAILGVIATFTIPKILSSSTDQKYNAAAKEAVATIVGAYDAYKLNNAASSITAPTDLTPYINYVGTTTASIDNMYGGGLSCGAGYTCLKLHNGGVLWMPTTINFGGTATTSAILFQFDPDGTLATNPKTLGIFLYYNDRITSTNTVLSSTTVGGTGAFATTYSPGVADPTWFSWSN